MPPLLLSRPESLVRPGRSDVRTLVLFLLLLPAIVDRSSAQPARLVDGSVGGRALHVYLPAGYDSTDERYPVILFFRGHQDEWLNRSEDGSRRGDIRTVIDSLTRNGSIGPAVYVFPWTPLPTAFPEDGFVSSTLLPYIDSTFRTIPSRFTRAIDGFSWGGLFTMAFMLRYPDRIASVGAYDPSVFALSYSDFQNRISEPGYLDRLRELSVWVTTAILGGNNNAGTRQLLDSLAQYGIQNRVTELVLDPAAQHNWYFADTHASRSLPQHWKTVHDPPRTLSVNLSGLQQGSVAGGVVPITWSVPGGDSSVRVFVQVSGNMGAVWHDIAQGSAAESTIQWDTSTLPDGSFYRMRVLAAGDTSFGSLDIQYCTIDNPGNAPPQVFFGDLKEGDELSGATTLRWVGGDPEGDVSTVSAAVSSDGGKVWSTLPGAFALTDSVVWDTFEYPNSAMTHVRLLATDGVDTSFVLSPRLVLHNHRQSVSEVHTDRRNMAGDGEVTLGVVHPEQVTGQRYSVTFSRDSEDPYHTASGKLSYAITNLSTSTPVLADVPVIPGVSEGPIFDGFRLRVEDVPSTVFDQPGTVWMAGSSNLTARLIVPEVILSPDTVRGRAFPADYVLSIADSIVDTTYSGFGLPVMPVAWSVRNRLTNTTVLVEFLDTDASGGLSHADELYFWERLPNRLAGGRIDTVLTWQAVLSSPPTFTPPVAGDSLLLSVLSPIHSGDVIAFDGIITAVSGESDVPLTPVISEAYPNPFNPSTRVRVSLPYDADLTVYVFDMLGQTVGVLHGGTKLRGEHVLDWNAEGLASGVYFLRVRVAALSGTPEVRTLTRKVILLR